MVSTDPMRAKIEAFARELAEEFGAIDEEGALSWLDAVETRSVEIGDALSAELLKQKSADQPIKENESICPKCGKLGQYKGRRERELIGCRGPTTITEPEYFCPCCRKAFFPGDGSNRR